MKIYQVYAEDLMSSMMSSSEVSVGHFKSYEDAVKAMREYNEWFEKHYKNLKGSSFEATIREIEVI